MSSKQSVEFTQDFGFLAIILCWARPVCES